MKTRGRIVRVADARRDAVLAVAVELASAWLDIGERPHDPPPRVRYKLLRDRYSDLEGGISLVGLLDDLVDAMYGE